MRRFALLSSLIALTLGCAGPHTTGALWSLQNFEQESVLFRLSAAQRAAGAQAFEVSLVDELVTQERARLSAELQVCPGAARQALAASPGDRVRDTMRIRAHGDPARLAAVAQLGLADWRLRRAQQTGDATWCETASAALAGSVSDAPAAQAATDTQAAQQVQALLAALGSATVARDAAHPGAPGAPGAPDAPDATAAPLLALSTYALGAVDSVTAAAPLPQYLAWVYGGTLVWQSAQVPSNDRPAEQLVDQLAPALPDWEPDALYAALLAQ